MSAPLRILLIGPAPPPYGGMALQAGQLKDLLAAEGHTVEWLPSNFECPRPVAKLPGVRTLYRLSAIWPKLWRASRNADVVHVLAASWFYFFAVVYPAVLVARLRGKHLVVNYRGGEAGAFFRGYGWLAGPALRMATRVTAPSGFLGALIHERFRIPVQIVPNILNRSRFVFRRRESFAPRLVVTRHLEEVYDVGSILSAFAQVQAAFPDASLCIAGSGNQSAMLRGTAEKLELRNVHFLGALSHADLPKLYDQCDVYVNASRVDNFPGALLEASAAGLVVVSTNAGGIPFLYEHGKSGLLVPVGDANALAESVISVLRKPELARRLVDEAVKMLSQSEWPNVRRELYRSYGIA